MVAEKHWSREMKRKKTCIINVKLFYAASLPAALFMSNG